MTFTSVKLAATSFLLAASMLTLSVAWAHGAAEPQYGGVVQTAADLSFELVSTPTGVAVYVLDHNKAYDASGMQGFVTVLNGAAKSHGPLKFAGGNKLEATDIRLDKGAKAVVVVTNNNSTAITVRFAFK